MSLGRNESNRTHQKSAETFDLTQDISSDLIPGTDQRHWSGECEGAIVVCHVNIRENLMKLAVFKSVRAVGHPRAADSPGCLISM